MENINLRAPYLSPNHWKFSFLNKVLFLAFILIVTLPILLQAQSRQRTSTLKHPTVVTNDFTASDTISITPTTNTDSLMNALLIPGTGITVTSVNFIGVDSAAGWYKSGPLGINDGIILSTGKVLDASPLDTTNASTDFGEPGDSLCNSITGPGFTSFDAARLELSFDVDISVNAISFQFIFGSEEYPTFVGMSFNDVFGTFLNGQQVAFDEAGNSITISGPFFADSNVVEQPANGMAYNGSTNLLQTQAPVTPGSTNNQLIFVICDGGDGKFDSGVLLASLKGNEEIQQPCTSFPPRVSCFTPDSVAIVAGNELTFDVTASDPEMELVELAVFGLPPGATMNPPLPVTVSGDSIKSTFSWTPDNAQAGEYTITYTAKDSCGLAVSCKVLVNVIEPPPPQGIFTSTTLAKTGISSFGAAWGDYNNDGFLDLFVANKSATNLLFRNTGGQLQEVVNAGNITATIGEWELGVWGDFDRNGDADLFVANSDGDNILYANQSGIFNKTFSTGTSHSEATTWVDFNNDGYLDVFIVNDGENNALYLNNTDGTFEEITNHLIVQDDNAHSSGCSWGDYDDDGDLDLFVTNNDSLKDFLYENTGNNTFKKIEFAEEISSKGCSWGDFDNDGDLDLFVTNENGENLLYEFDAQNKSFIKLGTSAGDIVTDKLASNGSAWGDYDNDGDLDLFVANENGATNSLYRNELMETGAATFTNMASLMESIVTDAFSSKGCAWGDYDNDGDIDLFVTTEETNEPNILYKNNGNNNNWVNIGLKGNISNRTALGAKVALKATLNGNDVWQYREITSMSGGNSQNSLRVAFGLGDAPVIDSLVVHWPSSSTKILTNVAINQFLEIEEELPPPHILCSASDSVAIVAGNELAFDVIASHPMMKRVELSVDSLPPRAIMNPPLPATGRDSVKSTFSWIPGNDQPGEYMITYTVTDSCGLTAACSVVVTVEEAPPANRSPEVAQPIQDQILNLSEVFQHPLDTVFQDPDGDSLSYDVAISPQNIAVANIANNSLFITPTAEGTATVAITATDPSAATAFDIFTVTINKITIVHNPPPSINPGVEEATIHFSIQNTTIDQVNAATLFYRTGGKSQLNPPIAMTLSGDSYEGVLPGDSLQSRGVEYFIEMVHSSGDTLRMPQEVSATISPPVMLSGEGIVNSQPQFSGSEQNAYRLISFPLFHIGKTPGGALEDDLGAYDDTKWRFFEPLRNNPFREFNDINNLQVGRAYWLLVKDAGKFIDTGPGQTLPINEPYKIPLTAGWNYIGIPFNFPIPYNNLALTSQEVPDIRSYNENGWNIFPDFSSAVSSPDTALKPFSGYAVQNPMGAEDTLIINPIISPAISTNVRNNSSQNMIDWGVRIVAQSALAKDAINIAGISENASNEWDRLDLAESPVIGEFVSVYFPHQEWEMPFAKFSYDIRPDIGDGDIWEFEVASNFNDAIHLGFENLDHVPEIFEIWLVDEVTQAIRNLRQNATYTIAGRRDHAPKKLKLAIGQPGFIDETLGDLQLIPSNFELKQNFPNPFNPSTTIAFGLPQPDIVNLTIYNISGQKIVSLLENARYEPGYHTAVWDGRNSAGNPVSSGVYFYRIRFNNSVKIRKMILVR